MKSLLRQPSAAAVVRCPAAPVRGFSTTRSLPDTSPSTSDTPGQRAGPLHLPRAGSQTLATSAASSSTSTSTIKDDFATDTRPVILYDGVCNLCNSAVNFMLDWDTKATCRMAALQSEAGQRLLQRSGRRPDDISSIVLVEKEQAYIKSEAVLRIAAKLNIPLAILAGLGFPMPLFIRDPVYDLVANNRYSLLGKREVCRLSDKRFEERFIKD